MLFIIPNELRDACDAAIDRALLSLPLDERPEAIASREAIRHDLYVYYNEHGYVPEFSLSKKKDLTP